MLNRVKAYQPGNRILSAADSVTLANWVGESLENGSTLLAIDLKRVSFIDSRGLGALVLAHNRVTKAGGILGICGATGQAAMVLEMSSMQNLFHTYASVAEFKEAIELYISAPSQYEVEQQEYAKGRPL